MDVTINETRMELPSEVITWGDLLDWVETRYLKAGQCITRVLFKEQEEIYYRKSAVCDREIGAVAPIRIESGEFDAVLKESFAELETQLREALASTSEIIRLLENRSEEQAHAALAELLESIRIFYSVFSEDLGWRIPPGVEAEPAATATLENAIRQLIAAQENQFWVSICDVLEYEITPVLESWLAIVENTRGKAS